jgi:hypothetical protein
MTGAQTGQNTADPPAELGALCAEIARRVRESGDAVEGARAFLDHREASWQGQQ